MSERFQEKNWEPWNREKEGIAEDWRHYQTRAGWQSVGSGYGAVMASEPFIVPEQFAYNQFPVYQPQFVPAMQQPFAAQPAQTFPQTTQQPILPQQYSYGIPLQQPFQMSVPPQNVGMPLSHGYAYGLQSLPQTQAQVALPQQYSFQPAITPSLRPTFPPSLQQPVLPQIPAQQPLAGYPNYSQQSFGYGQPLQGQPMQQPRTGLKHFSGRGPRNYRRPDERIREDVIERLTTHPEIDATNVEIGVKNGEVTIKGFVEDRIQKRMIEDITETVFGVSDVQNSLRIEPSQWNQFQTAGVEKEGREK